MWLLFITLSACGPATTGPGLAVGVVTTADGSRVEGLQVDTIEGRAFTDAGGRFEVHWKAPSQHVDWTFRGARYVRTFRPDDRGEVLAVRLPETQDTTLRCARVATCDLQLRWDLGDGLVASARPACALGETVSLEGVPVGTPQAVCAARPGVPESPARLTAMSSGYVLSDDPHRVRVELHALDGELPADCVVAVEGVRAPATEDGAWVREVGGSALVQATCEGRPALPRRVEVTAPITVALSWSPVGPDLDLAPWLPPSATWTDQVDLSPAGDRGLALPLPADARGVYPLPPLNAGTWVFSAGEQVAPPEGELEPGVLHVVVSPHDAGFVGVLVLDEDLDSGSIPVRTR